MISLAVVAMMFALSGKAPVDENGHHTGGRTFESEEIETESAIFTPFQKHQWPGTYFETAFTGRKLVLFFRSDNHNRYRLYIDDRPPVIIDRPDLYYYASNLKSGKHTARLEKLSESQDRAEGFYGFGTLGKGKIKALPRRTRQIEFIGDSYTVGYGNASGKRECTPEELRVTTDTQMAYGPLTAKYFDADYQINAVSGRGIVRNYDGFAGDTLPELYPFVLFDKQSAYLDKSWMPQVIVIGLGGNDFSTPLKPGEKWQDEDALKAHFEAAYIVFVQWLRANNPQALIVLTKYQGPVVAAEVDRVAAALKAGGDMRIDIIGMDDFTKNGCDWHLDVEDDRKIARQLIARLGGMPDEPHIEDTLPLPDRPWTDMATGSPAPLAEPLPAFPQPDPAIGEPLVATKLLRNQAVSTPASAPKAMASGPPTLTGKVTDMRAVLFFVGDVPLTSTAYRIERAGTGGIVVVLGGGECTLELGQTYELWLEKWDVHFTESRDEAFNTDLAITVCRPAQASSK